MSADSWAICPCCLKKAQQAHDDANTAIRMMYGQVPFEELQAAQKIIKDVNPEEYRTFREEYEVGLSKDEFSVDYYGECQECELSLTFRESKKLEFE